MKLCSMRINDESMTESYKNNAENEIETITITYGGYSINSKQYRCERGVNGDFIIKDFRNDNDVKFTVRSLNDELPDSGKIKRFRTIFEP